MNQVHLVYLMHHFHLAHLVNYVLANLVNYVLVNLVNFVLVNLVNYVLAGNSGCSGLGALLPAGFSSGHHTQKHRLHTGHPLFTLFTWVISFI